MLPDVATSASTNEVQAVLFDLDGTLYRQSPVRRTMMLRLLRAHMATPVSGVRVVRILAAYRRAQETLRTSGFEGDVATAQLELAARHVGVGVDVVRANVDRWMDAAPLDVVASSARAGLADALDALRARGLKLGVVSDYPAHGKLQALGISDRFASVVSAQDPRVGAFKPNPRGLLVALEDLGVDGDHAVYVGDRTDVDGQAAAAAMMRCILIGGGDRGDDRAVPRVADFKALVDALERP